MSSALESSFLIQKSTCLSSETRENPYYIDVETCGLYGIIVTIQYALGDGEPVLYEVWKEPVSKTLALIRTFCYHRGGVVFFNAAFDWFHLGKLYNCLLFCENLDEPPDPFVVAEHEQTARDGLCLKPVSILDLFLHARKTSYQSTMERSDISIRRVPVEIAPDLALELEKRVKLNPIYFARREDKSLPQWQLTQSEDYVTKKPIAGMMDVVLRFAPSSGLKALAADALGITDVVKYGDVEIDKQYRPIEKGWMPFALRDENGDLLPGSWPTVIAFHIHHWNTNVWAREYAINDIIYLRKLHEFFKSGGNKSKSDTIPEFDDDDSVLAASVAAVRWKGYALDLPKLQELLDGAKKLSGGCPTAPKQVAAWIAECMNDVEREVFNDTKKTTLAEIAKWRILDAGYECDKPEAHTAETAAMSCAELHGAPSHPHPAAVRAKMVENARAAQKEIETFEKLLEAKRFHPSFKVIGALSSRMSGADGLNPHGIKHSLVVRSAFTMAFKGEFLSGGDFKSFEVVLAEAEYNDPKLRAALMSGKKIHGLFGTKLFPDMTYEDILASEGTKEDKYFPAKGGVFSMIYGGDHNTLHKKQGVSLDVAERAYNDFMNEYEGISRARKTVFAMFCSMSQPSPGGPVVWKEPADYIESMFGFRRYFTLENTLTRALFDLAEHPLAKWKDLKIRVKRREKVQTAAGATRSALYGAAFGVQSQNMRAAANHKIQSSGAQITKRLQRRIWDLQPAGINPWRVRPMNAHDEVLVASDSIETAERVARVVDQVVSEYKARVPLLAIDWKLKMSSWAGKKAA